MDHDSDSTHNKNRRAFLFNAATLATASLGTIVASSSLLTPKKTMAATRKDKVVNLYTWPNYLGQHTAEQFKAKTGIKLNVSYYGDNNELFTKIRNGNPGYDVIIPSSFWIQRFVEAGLLDKINHSKIPNMVNLFPRFRDASFDKGHIYTMPYMWGTIGIGYRKSAMKGIMPDSWKYLFQSDTFKNRMAILSECGIILACALMYLGYDPNSIDPQENQKAADLLVTQKKYITSFAPDNEEDLLEDGQVDITMGYSGDITQVMADDDDLDYLIPKEGGLLWQDLCAIPKGAPHKEAAHELINFLYDPQIGADVAKGILYATPNQAAYKLLPTSMRSNPAIFPPDNILKQCKDMQYLGEKGQKMREDLCTKIHAA